MFILPIKTFAALTSISALMLMAACDTTSYDELQTTEATAGEFSKALRNEYRIFAKSEIDQYDWPDQQLIAKKGLQAARGARPLPEEPKNWNIEKEAQDDLLNSRKNLIHWLNTDARFKEPNRSARAQASFDCWVEQKEENWQIEHINTCKDGTALALPDITRISFAFDKFSIGPASLEHLRKVALDWQNDPSEFLLLQGHTDQVGDKPYNYTLSKKRAEAVKRSLLAFGVPKDQIYMELWGKTRPRAELSDDSKPISNRRVEILKF